MKTLLERHFDTAFDAPDGIKRLRELILSLAMQGKLVKEDPNDPPASELLKEIESEKKRLIKAGKIKQSQPLPPIKPEEVPYELPKSWAWVRLGMVSDYNGRRNIFGDAIDPDTWVLDLEDIEKETSRILCRAKFSERQSKSSKSTFLKGDVLYGKLRPYLDKVVVADSDGVCTTEIVPIVPCKGLTPEFLRWLLKRPAFLNHVSSLVYGVKMPRLGSDDAVMSVHPLPPLPEQHRIVAKIDQLMARCDALEKLRAEREQKRLVVHAAAIRQLLDSASLPSRPQHVQPFLFSHFSELYTVKENVSELRKALLQLAVMGKLVSQDPNDEPAATSICNVTKDAAKAIRDGTIRRHGLKEPANNDNLPELPSGWRWTRLVEVTRPLPYAIKRGPFGSSIRKDMFVDKGFKVYEQQHAIYGDFTKGRYYINKAKFEELIAFELYPGDILVSCSGTVGKVAIAPQNIERGIINQALLKLSLHQSVLLNEYFLVLFPAFFMETDTLTNLLGTAQKNIPGMDVLKAMPFPLPPLAEQHRIVAKIDQLMALCDTMENQITSATAKQTTLLTALMARA